jgi:hypothetical protein
MFEINQNNSSENEKVIDEKFSEEEINNIREIDELLDSEFIRIEQNSNITLKFMLSEKVQPIEKEYNGKKFIQYRFTVMDLRTGKIKKFDVGKIAALDIKKKFIEGHKVLNIERIGSGTNTKYIPRPVSNKNI